MSRPRLTLCVLTAAEEPGLSDSLASARTAVDEVVVGYTGSADTAPDLSTLGARIVLIPWGQGFAAARNAMLDAVDGDWILVLDADERIELPGPDTLRELVAPALAPGFLLPIRSPSGPGQGSETFLSYQVRLFRNHPDHRYEGVLGEQLPGWLVAAAGEHPVPSGVIIHHTGFAQGEVEGRSRRNVEVLGGGSSQVAYEPNLALARGLQLLRQGCLDQACSQFAASGTAEGVLVAHIIRWLAYTLLALGRPNEALGLLEYGCGHHPAYTDLWLLWGQALAAVGRMSEAELALRRCLDLGEAPPPYESAVGSGNALPLLALGSLEERAGRPAEALACYTRAYQARPECTKPLYRAAAALGLLGRTREIMTTLRELVHPTDAEHWLLLADVLSVHRQYRSALRCVDYATRFNGDPADVALMRGFCLLRSGEPGEAEAALAAVPPDHSQARQALRMRLLAAWCRHDFPVARALLERVGQNALPAGVWMAIQSLHWLLCLSETQMASTSGWGQEGGEFLLDAVDVLLAAGRRQDAEAAAALMERSGWPGGNRALALIFRLRGQDRLARTYFERTLANSGPDPGLLCSLAELELKGRNWPRALALVTQATEMDPEDPLPYLLRARIFRAQAIDLLRAAKKHGDDPEVEQLLAELTGAPTL